MVALRVLVSTYRRTRRNPHDRAHHVRVVRDAHDDALREPPRGQRPATGMAVAGGLMGQWLDNDGLVHMKDDVLQDESTWCGRIMFKRFAGAYYTGDPTDLPPTCVVCIANAQRFYSLPNIRKKHERIRR
jgi:hypothetical protein